MTEIYSFLNDLKFKGQCQKTYIVPSNLNQINIPQELINADNYKEVIIYVLSNTFDFNVRYRLLNQILDIIENTNQIISLNDDEGHYLLVLILEEHYVNTYYHLCKEHIICMKDFFIRCLKHINLDIYRNVSDNDDYEKDENGNITIISMIKYFKNSIKENIDFVYDRFISNGYIYYQYHRYSIESFNTIDDFIVYIKTNY